MIGTALRAAALGGLALLLGTATPVAAAAQPDEAAFTRDMAEQLRAAVPGRPFAVSGPLEIRLDRPDEESLQINVGRIYNFCASAPTDECEASRAQFVTSVADIVNETPAPLTRAQLRVAVRSTDFCDHLATLEAERPGQRPLTRPGPAAGLCTVLMADYPNRKRTVPGGDLPGLALDAAAAWALAERQTLADLPAPDGLEGLEHGLVVVADVDYVPSLILAADGWRRAAAGGEILLAVPEDGLAVVARRANIPDLAGFRRTVRESFETGERGISPHVYRWTAAGWVVAE